MNAPWLEVLGWALLHSLWQGVLLGGAAALALRLLRRADGRTRYLLAYAALLACLLLPVVTALSRSVPVGATDEGLGTADWTSMLESGFPWLVGLWLSGFALMTLRLLGGLLWVERLRRAGEAWRDPQWRRRLDGLALRLGIKRPVGLRLVAELSGPVTVGWLRPVVLLPAALVARMPADLLEALLAHELAHIRRFDYLANLLQSVVEALLFHHPVVWWLSRQVRVEREQIADDLAALVLGEPRRLALALGELSRWEPPLAQAAQGGELLARIRRLLRPAPQPARRRFGPVLLGACALGMVIQAHGLIGESPTEPTSVPAHASVPRLPVLQNQTLRASHALVIDDQGRVLLQKDADRVVPIASLTKLMTAMVVLDARPDMAESIRIDASDVESGKRSASKVAVGTTLPRAQMLDLALGVSDNRAAKALARTYPGGPAAFAQAVQAKIAALGLTHTSIHEPTGLSPRNTSTATDLARLVQAASRYPAIAGTQAKSAVVARPGWDVLLSKTGFTREAGRCLTLRARSVRGDVTVVLLHADGAESRVRDAVEILSRLERTPAL
ncbi:M56 family metallopeptidase [Chitinimonas lacunae]|uniref:M56 family metallopeptidase n=1 Tax=Chitinimonas lacunae TaxID=1963018 RepID=A0ABV8MS20_9NEIS